MITSVQWFHSSLFSSVTTRNSEYESSNFSASEASSTHSMTLRPPRTPSTSGSDRASVPPSGVAQFRPPAHGRAATGSIRSTSESVWGLNHGVNPYLKLLMFKSSRIISPPSTPTQSLHFPSTSSSQTKSTNGGGSASGASRGSSSSGRLERLGKWLAPPDLVPVSNKVWLLF